MRLTKQDVENALGYEITDFDVSPVIIDGKKDNYKQWRCEYKSSSYK